MIPAIGLMIAAYIFTRMVESCMNQATPMLVKLFAVITMLVAVAGALGLYFSASTLNAIK